MKSRLLVVAAVSILLTTAAFGQATRTWVSGVGDDANPCSRTAPCKTFAGAISKTAAGGQISVLDPGGFGGVTITKSMTIDGAGTMASILNSSSQNGVFINALTTDTVILRNLAIDGAGSGLNGVRVLQAGKVVIEDCAIMGSSVGVLVNNTTNSIFLFLHNVDISRITGNGITLSPTAPGLAIMQTNGVRIANTGNDGINMANGQVATQIHDTQIWNTSGGSCFHQVGGASNIDGGSFDRCGIDGFRIEAGVAHINNSNAVQNNGAGFNRTGGTLFSYKNNRSSDNGIADVVPTQANFF